MNKRLKAVNFKSALAENQGVGLMLVINYVIIIVLGLGTGAVVAGAVFAFVSAIGVVPRLAQKTGTQKNIKFYETSLMMGGLFGVFVEMVEFRLLVGHVITTVFALCSGIFIGALAVSLAETLDVIPIMTRRIRLQKGMVYFVLAIAIGKMGGSLLYALVPGFYTK